MTPGGSGRLSRSDAVDEVSESLPRPHNDLLTVHNSRLGSITLVDPKPKEWLFLFQGADNLPYFAGGAWSVLAYQRDDTVGTADSRECLGLPVSAVWLLDRHVDVLERRVCLERLSF